MNPRTLREYKRLRALGWRAGEAYRAATIKRDWRIFECGEFDSPEIGCVRLQIVADDCNSYDDVYGDMFNPKANPDIPPARLERERKAEEDRIDRLGVVGIIGEYWDGERWQHAESCFGFVGDDWRDSGYDVDIMRATLDAVREFANARLLLGAV